MTDREREVLVQVSAAVSNDEIAEQLTLSTAAVKTHVSRGMSKLAARSGAAGVLAYETGLVSPGRADVIPPL